MAYTVRDLFNQILNSTETAIGTVDLGSGWTTTMGLTSQARFTSADQSGAVADVTAAPTSGEYLVITDIVVGADTAMRVDFSEETAGTIFLSVYLSANSTIQVTLRGKFKLNTADKKLQVRTSAAGNVAVQVLYYSEA